MFITICIWSFPWGSAGWLIHDNSQRDGHLQLLTDGIVQFAGYTSCMISIHPQYYCWISFLPIKDKFGILKSLNEKWTTHFAQKNKKKIKQKLSHKRHRWTRWRWMAKMHPLPWSCNSCMQNDQHNCVFLLQRSPRCGALCTYLLVTVAGCLWSSCVWKLWWVWWRTLLTQISTILVFPGRSVFIVFKPVAVSVSIMIMPSVVSLSISEAFPAVDIVLRCRTSSFDICMVIRAGNRPCFCFILKSSAFTAVDIGGRCGRSSFDICLEIRAGYRHGFCFILFWNRQLLPLSISAEDVVEAALISVWKSERDIDMVFVLIYFEIASFYHCRYRRKMW